MCIIRKTGIGGHQIATIAVAGHVPVGDVAIGADVGIGDDAIAAIAITAVRIDRIHRG